MLGDRSQEHSIYTWAIDVELYNTTTGRERTTSDYMLWTEQTACYEAVLHGCDDYYSEYSPWPPAVQGILAIYHRPHSTVRWQYTQHVAKSFPLLTTMQANSIATLRSASLISSRCSVVSGTANCQGAGSATSEGYNINPSLACLPSLLLPPS